ncbi:Hypothetical protein MALK_0200 [Metamycoplasma alkalescens 14918]|uniref:SGNH hydrolase-type esterase domain-containing protein n=1 Tax=Metamycoplasma alkalescens 14918 TaxID=1188234 RepID=N9U0Y8_9BACT|nr:SGNH/GDSL hydrolase family protein [Metamycoplasma alkalescens]ENY54207.1 Hypothetical protein MALK_0200 [Metamycoplasma alkalescens 14918]
MQENNNKKIKINYVALGEAFASGYNSKLGFSTNGYLDANNEIHGLCYPTVIANLIKNNQDFMLESFYNLAVPTNSLRFLEALYSNDKKALKKMNNIIDLIQAIDWISTNPFKNYFSNFLNDWNINNDDFSFFSKKIKEANFITITAGFFDFFNKLPFKHFRLLNKIDQQKKAEEISIIKKIIEEISIEVKNKLISLIKSIQNKNKQAKIVLTNYPQLLLHLKFAINSYVNPKQANEFNLYHFIQINFDKAIKEAAKKVGCDFIDVNDTVYWNENKKYLFENIFAFYPTEKGYKKIGLDIYTKLFINKNAFKEDLKNIEFLNKYISSQSYWENDIDLYHSIHEVNNNHALFKQVYGKNKNESIYLLDDNEKKYQDLLNYKIRISDFLTLFLRYYNVSVSELTRRLIISRFNQAKENYQFIEKLTKFLSNEQRTKEIILILLKNQKTDNILYILEQILFKKELLENKKIDLNLIKKELFKILRDNQYLVYDVLKYFFNSQLINESRKEINEIIELFVKESLNTKLLSYLFNFNNNQKFEKIINYLLSLDSFKDFINFFVESLVNYSNVYVNLKNFDELWKHFIVKNKYNLLLLFDKILVELTNENNFSQTVDFFTQAINDLLRLELESKDYKLLKNSISNIIDIFKNNPKYWNYVVLKFLDKIKNLSLYDLIFQIKENKQKIIKWTHFIAINRYLILGFRILKNIQTIKKIIAKYKI